MSEGVAKVSQSASPLARAGAGDLTERAFGRERRALCATPPAGTQRVYPKKLFSTPVSKFTCGRVAPGASSPQLARIRSCLDECRRAASAASVERTKASSMEDLTPSKRVKKESDSTEDKKVAVSGPRSPDGAQRARAAARVGRFMVVAAWRRRREEVLTLRKTLDSKRSSGERLRVQVWALKSLLDADNAKVVLAMRELERLKQLLRDRDLEKTLLEREKAALEKDVSTAEDRVSELSIGWRNSRNELDALRDALQRSEHERGAERAAAADARAQRDRAYCRINLLEEELAQHEALLHSSEEEMAVMRAEGEARERALRLAAERLRQENEARTRSVAQCSALQARASHAEDEVSSLRSMVAELRAQLASVEAELVSTREQLDWWPRPLTRMLGAARSLFRHPMSLPEAVMWSLIPSRLGCH